jgi:predicted tellurium resistance membrane protein TerC
MEWFADPEAWIALLTLTALEIVLGIDNIVFISVLVGRLPEAQRNRARTIGLGLAMGSRLLLLFSLTWIMDLGDTLFTLGRFDISWRDVVLMAGGLFLLRKSVHEIHEALEGDDDEDEGHASATFGRVLIQIAVIDMVFSLDSVITAVGLVDHRSVMVIAIVIAVTVMMFAARPVGEFVERHPTIKMLALSFLILIGFVLVAEGLGVHVPKAYIYFAMGFSIAVEMLNLRLHAKSAQKRRIADPVKLRKSLSRRRKRQKKAQ